MKNKAFIAVVLCVVFFFLAIFSAEGFNWNNLKSTGNAITTDELTHITGGYYYFQTHRYMISVGHPPLVKDLAALPLLFLHPAFPAISSTLNLPSGYAWRSYPSPDFIFSTNLERVDDSWDLGRLFLYSPDNNTELIIFWARLSVIFFNALFLFILYLAISVIWNKRAALLSLFLLVFSQLNLAHGSLVDMDFMSSVLQMITLTFFASYLTRKTTRYFWLTATFLSLALLAKLSSLILLPVIFLGGLVYIFTCKKSWREVWIYIWHCCEIFLLTTLIISTVYAFQVFDMQPSDILYQMHAHFPTGVYHFISTHIPLGFFANPFTKGLAEYTVSISMLSTRLSEAQQTIYFLGHVYGTQGAGLAYFPVLYATKLSLGFLFLAAFSLLFSLNGVLKKIRSNNRWQSMFNKFLEKPLAFLLILFVGLYTVPTLSTKLQIGVRYILPIIFATTLLTASFLDSHWEGKIFEKIKLNYLFSLALAVMALSVFLSFPYYISYYNPLGGGTANGYQIATDSNYDWGCQDIKKLEPWIATNKLTKPYIDIPGGSYPLEYYLGTNYQSYNVAKQPLPPAGSVIAMSVAQHQFNRDNPRVKILDIHLVARLGTTILIFRVP